jgi:hypothetical protein
MNYLPQTMMLPISASQVAGITDVSPSTSTALLKIMNVPSISEWGYEN